MKKDADTLLAVTSMCRRTRGPNDLDLNKFHIITDLPMIENIFVLMDEIRCFLGACALEESFNTLNKVGNPNISDHAIC